MPRPLNQTIQDHLVDWRDRRWPIDWTEVFGRVAPVTLEIGFGNGEFLARQAKAHPEHDHVGLELSWSAATRLFRRLDAAGVRNARALLVDADVALQNLFSPGSVDEVFVNHPCPWPKARHHARRLLHPDGLALLSDRMKPGAGLTIVTDHDEYAEWLTEILIEESSLSSCHAGVETTRIPGRQPTKYERKALAEDDTIHYFEWRRTGPSRLSLPTLSAPSSAMPSLTLKRSSDSASLFAGFESRTLRERHDGVDVVLRLLHAYRQVEGDSWLIEVLLMEDRLRQAFAVLVVERPSGELLVKLSELGSPHPTYGVKRAVFCVGHWLMTHDPGLELTHENLGADAMRPFEPS